MSSPASRRRQRQRRRAREKLWAAQKVLADRQVDLVSYDRVIADMHRRYRAGELSPYSGAQALSIVKVLRDATENECVKLTVDVSILQDTCKKLGHEDVSP